MARNVEIKARIFNVEALTRRITEIADSGPINIMQDDTFFQCESGRLKLRQFPDGDGELIFYRRPKQQGPKESFYLRSRTPDPLILKESLTLAYGERGRIKKHRTLFVVGKTRIHLDVVENLGDFLELEVVLDDGESLEAGVRETERLMDLLRIKPAQLVEGAYVDLLEETNDI